MKIDELTVDLIDSNFKRQLSDRDRYSAFFCQLIYQIAHSVLYTDDKINHFINHFGRIFYQDLDILVALLQSYDGLTVKEIDSKAIDKNAKMYGRNFANSKADLGRLLKKNAFNKESLFPYVLKVAPQDLNDQYYPVDHSFKKLSEDLATYYASDKAFVLNITDIRSIEQSIFVIMKKLYVLYRKMQFSYLLLDNLKITPGKVQVKDRVEGPAEALDKALFHDPGFTDYNIEYCIRHIASVYVLRNGNRMKPESIRRVINRCKKNGRP